MASMRTWIYALKNLFPSYLVSPAQWVADRIYGVYDDSVRFSKWIRSGWADLFPSITRFSWRLRGFVTETFSTIFWITAEFIPTQIYFASVHITDYVLGHLNAIKQFLWDHIANVIDWAQRLINEINGKLWNFLVWARDRVNELWDTLARVRDLAWTLLTDPRKLAAWLVGAMITEIGKWVYANRLMIGDWILRNSPAFTAFLARELSRMIGRLL